MATDFKPNPIHHPSLESLKHVHIVGVCGTLMGAFASFLRGRGVRVTGSDQNVYPPMSDVLNAAGVELMSGFKAQNITQFPDKPDLVIIGNVISRQNEEAIEATNGRYCFSSLPETMEKILLTKTKNIVVSGTHGKTTTSSLMAYVLKECHLNPNYFFGGVAHDLPESFRVANIEAGTPFVLEGDEYDTAYWDKVPKFNHYLPDDAVLTSIEFDHADIYKDIDAVKRAFLGLLERIRKGGSLTACTDYPIIREMLSKSRVPVTRYGIKFTADNEIAAGKIEYTEYLTRFEVLDCGKCVDEISMNLPGKHNVLNALAVWIEARRLKLDPEQVRLALGKFRGVKRRQEIRGEVNGITVIDDFAHHPTAVRETLSALKAKYPTRRLIAVFEPRSATSRRKVFQKDFVEAFCCGELTFVSSPYDQSKIASDDLFSSDQLVSDLTSRGNRAELFSEVDAGVTQLKSKALRGDVIVVMSNGGFGGFIPKLLQSLESK